MRRGSEIPRAFSKQGTRLPKLGRAQILGREEEEAVMGLYQPTQLLHRGTIFSAILRIFQSDWQVVIEFIDGRHSIQRGGREKLEGPARAFFIAKSKMPVNQRALHEMLTSSPAVIPTIAIRNRGRGDPARLLWRGNPSQSERKADIGLRFTMSNLRRCGGGGCGQHHQHRYNDVNHQRPSKPITTTSAPVKLQNR